MHRVLHKPSRGRGEGCLEKTPADQWVPGFGIVRESKSGKCDHVLETADHMNSLHTQTECIIGKTGGGEGVQGCRS